MVGRQIGALELSVAGAGAAVVVMESIFSARALSWFLHLGQFKTLWNDGDDDLVSLPFHSSSITTSKGQCFPFELY